MNPIDEIHELGLAIENCEDRQVAAWLVELLHIKEARVASEVMQYEAEIEADEDEDEDEDEHDVEDEAKDTGCRCPRCGEMGGITDYGNDRVSCGNCGAQILEGESHVY